MNSLNILPSHVPPSASTSPTRSNSISAFGIAVTSETDSTQGGRVGVSNSSGSGGSSSSNSNSGCALGNSTDGTFATGPGTTADGASNTRRSSASATGTMVLSDPYPESFGAGAGGDADRKETFMTSTANEATPLLQQKDMYGNEVAFSKAPKATWASLPNRIAITVWHSIRWVLQTLAAPGVYLVTCFYDIDGNFAPMAQLKLLFGQPRPTGKRGLKKKDSIAFYDEQDDFTADDEKSRRLSTESEDSVTSWRERGRPFFAASTLPRANSYAVSSESESDFDQKGTKGKSGTGTSKTSGTPRASGGAGSGPRRKATGDGTGRRGTGGSRSGGDEDSAAGGSPGARRSVRIKLNDDTLRQRKHRKGQLSSSSASLRGNSGSAGPNYGSGAGENPKDILAQLKSPTSPAGALTKYPRAPVPPRPLIPRRQPSYLNLESVDRAHQKTLILDLDETLIHSMSKGGRMSTGHMVEVRLNTTFVGMGGQPSLGPQHPILYYVHKRPYCDEFLRRVSKWYNLVVFTASVQEYADPVIDWLESERKFFSARYYRQHCTFRHGAFIKDLSAVEPDLSKVMILDNSPLSYMFHQDNAIPIQGWISDHTDSDLLHLVPLLEGLQYVSDVRALLALRGGEDGMHMA